MCWALCSGRASVSESDVSEGVGDLIGVESTEGSLARSWVGEFGKDLKKVVRCRGE
jgi:hypothetical protein